MKKVILTIIISTFMLIGVQSAKAGMLNLTTEGSSGYINNAYFEQIDPQSTGTGVIDPFLRIEHNRFEQGYNTNYRYQPGGDTQFNEKKDLQYTHALLLSSVPIIQLTDGQYYLQFMLDINQIGKSDPDGGSPTSSFISLDELRIYQSNSSLLHDYNPSNTNWGGLNPVYRMDTASADNWIKLDADLNSGSGSGDMFAYIPFSSFDLSKQYVYLYS